MKEKVKVLPDPVGLQNTNRFLPARIISLVLTIAVSWYGLSLIILVVVT
jgi:hypothetical protein